MEGNEVILFRCESPVQLLNAINIKYSLLPDEVADISFSSTTDFSHLLGRLKDTQLFNKIMVSPDRFPEEKFDYLKLNPKERDSFYKYPEKNVHEVGYAESYTDYYVPTRNPQNLLLFYSMVKKGRKPVVHVYEEGISTYVMDMVADGNKKSNPQQVSYKTGDRFHNNIKEVLVYEPELCTIKSKVSIGAIPKIKQDDKQLIGLVTDIFGQNELPKEKYVFLEEAAFTDKRNTTDVDLLDTIAEAVGKDNIAVKLHPRSVFDRFTSRGYKVLPSSATPWEVTMLLSDTRDKVFLTISSSSTISSKLMMDKDFRIIFLNDLMKVSKSLHTRQKMFDDYFKRLVKITNSKNRILFTPNSMESLHVCLEYISERLY